MASIDLSTAATVNFTVKTGQTFEPVLTFTDKDTGDPIDFTDATVKMSIRQRIGCAANNCCSDNYNQIFEQDLATGDGITIGGADNNVLTFEKEIVLAPARYKYDLLVVFPDGTQTYYLQGDFKVEKSYTHAD